MNRRQMLELTGISVLTAGATVGGAWWYVGRNTSADPVKTDPPKRSERNADVVIIGGGFGGCAAALGALRQGAKVVMTEETDWIGGQSTSQIVPPDENRWIEEPFGSTKSYQAWRQGIRDHYQKLDHLLPGLKKSRNLNPGSGWVSRICHEPTVGLAVLQAMLQPYIDKKQLEILLDTKPLAADVDGDRIRSVTVQKTNGDTCVLTGPYFLDATEQGDLLPLTKCEHVTGAESQKETNEPSAPLQANPTNIQSFTWCFALAYDPNEKHTIEKPKDYEFWKNHEPKTEPPYGGKMLSWIAPGGRTTFSFDPLNDKTPTANMWTYRRILNRRSFVQDHYKSDVTVVNWSSNDYFLGPIHAVSEEEVKKHLEASRQLSLSLLYWMQTEAPRPDGKVGWPGLHLRPDITGTKDGLAKYPYIRESRRIKADFTILQQHVIRQERVKLAKKAEEAQAEPFPDSVGIGHYPMDIHPTSGGNNGRGWPSCPFRIPMGALIPVRITNLLAACKNLGVTQLSNGCYRLHPVEWNIGESAGALAAYCVKQKKTPKEIRAKAELLEAFQKYLQNDGIPIQWPKDVAIANVVH